MTDRALDLTVSVVSYNTVDLVTACLRSVFANAGDLALEVILVDNASQDGTVEKVRAEFPQVHVIANAENRYFARGHNQAARLARGRYILFLNSDTLVLPGSLPALVAFLDAHPEYGAAGCQERDGQGRVLMTGTGVRTPLVDLIELTFPSFFLPRVRQRFLARYYLTDWDRLSNREVPVLTDACLMVRKALFWNLGCYDEALKLYYTENDLCLRLWRSGARVYYLSNVGFVHYLHGSTNRVSTHTIQRILSQDRFHYHRKHYGRATAFVVRTADAIRRSGRRALGKS